MYDDPLKPPLAASRLDVNEVISLDAAQRANILTILHLPNPFYPPLPSLTLVLVLFLAIRKIPK
jgi:hypothetical protein